MAKTTKLVGYGIAFDMKLVGGAKTADDFKKAAKSVQKSLNASENAVKQYVLKQEQLNQALRKGAITKKQYDQAMTTLAFREQKRIDRLEKERRAVLGLDKQESILERNRRNRARMAGMAASGASGLGFGGRTAGAARFLGGAAGLGPAAASLGVGFGGLTLVKDSVSAYAELEAKVAGLKTLFGEGLGAELTEQFKELAKTTILTNNQLIENAKTWASYGLTTDSLTDRLRRLGTVAGGNSEKFRQLTIAFAQVNAQGKLMGQEKNQLINAGFSLEAVADAAGITMEDFADAMKNGEIKADHLNKALIKVTSEGGLFAGYLEKQADTISGKMTILSSTWQEFLQTLGEAEKGPAGRFLDQMIEAAEKMTAVARYFNIGEIDAMPGSGSEAKAAGTQVFSQLLGGVGKQAQVDLGLDLDDAYKATRLLTGGYEIHQEAILQLAKDLGLIEKDLQPFLKTLHFDRLEHDINKKYGLGGAYADPSMSDISEQEKRDREKREKEQLEADKKLFEDAMMNQDLTLQMFNDTLNKIQTESIKKEMEQMRSFVPGAMSDDAFFDVMLSEKEERDRERNEQEMSFKKRQMEHLHQLAIEDAKEKKELEFSLLKEQFKQREQDVSEQLAIEKKLAAGPADKDAYFTGGSVEEFMFLRRQAQVSEEAKATKEAEDRAQEQRRQINEERKQAEIEFRAIMAEFMGRESFVGPQPLAN
jgi:tape measure domain-containing protein